MVTVQLNLLIVVLIGGNLKVVANKLEATDHQILAELEAIGGVHGLQVVVDAFLVLTYAVVGVLVVFVLKVLLAFAPHRRDTAYGACRA